MVDGSDKVVWLVIGCTVQGNPRTTLPSPTQQRCLSFISPRHGKNCAYGAGLHHSMSLGFMSLTMVCFAQNHHGSYARSGKGHWYSSVSLLTMRLRAHRSP